MTGPLNLAEAMESPRMDAQASEARAHADWIWTGGERSPQNRFTYFRKVIRLESIPEDATLRLAADSTAWLWINGQVVRRKVARYTEEQITAEVINAGPYLRVGANVIVALHYNWGEIVTFQRTGNRHAGLWLNASWIGTDASWRWIQAPEFVEHEQRIPGVIGHDRIRYPVMVDARRMLAGDLHDPEYDDRGWASAQAVGARGPWPACPEDVETPGQREYFVAPFNVLAAGQVASPKPPSDDPLSMAKDFHGAELQPQDDIAGMASNNAMGKPWQIEGKAGEAYYVTFDFGRPIHGYPMVDLADASAGVVIDCIYGEIARSLYTGKVHVKPNGWIDSTVTVGEGYADRIITRAGAQQIELPDERTARWLVLHLRFTQGGAIRFARAGFIKSQYPIRMVGSFECGDERIQQIVRLCQVHAEVSMTDAYVDTPGREDGQWLEDAQPRALLAERWYGDHQLRRLLIRTHAQSQREDGHLHPFAPSNFPAWPAVYDWSVQWIACLYDDYLWTGKTDLIRQYWKQICLYWESVLTHVNEEGLWLTPHVLADIRVGVPCVKKHHSSGIVTPWMIERLRWSEHMARAIGQIRQAEGWETTRKRMIEAFRRHHLVPASGDKPPHVADRYDARDPEAPRGYSQAGQTIAITSGLLTEAEARADLEYAFPAPDGTPPPGVTRWNNPTYSARVLSALTEAGLTERAVEHLLERYGPYLPGHPKNPTAPRLQGPLGGPLPEYWVSREDLGLKEGAINTAQPADETGSHGWGAVPLLWMHEYLLGVKIAEPGGGRLRIAPRTGGLPYVAGQTMTPKGIVWVYWDPQPMRLEVQIPSDVTAELVMPEGFVRERWQKECLPQAGRVETTSDGHLLLTGGGLFVFCAR